MMHQKVAKFYFFFNIAKNSRKFIIVSNLLRIFAKRKMKYDLFESISQRSHGEKDSENRRIAEIADEIRRRSSVYEAESGFGEKHVSRTAIFTWLMRKSREYKMLKVTTLLVINLLVTNLFHIFAVRKQCLNT
ncbi:MAG: hypothetical protein IKW78_06750 [Prevotella sp.]|nr:hypothetical protein [Prevotella sp.]